MGGKEYARRRTAAREEIQNVPIFFFQNVPIFFFKK
jgi:hypothetical protein